MKQKADNTDKHLTATILILFLTTFAVLGGYQLYTMITEG